jgi:hypothetical protein
MVVLDKTVKQTRLEKIERLESIMGEIESNEGIEKEVWMNVNKKRSALYFNFLKIQEPSSQLDYELQDLIDDGFTMNCDGRSTDQIHDIATKYGLVPVSKKSYINCMGDFNFAYDLQDEMGESE